MSTKVASYVVLAVACVAIYFAVRLFRRQKLTIGVFLMWVGLWGGMGLFSLFPAALDYFMRLVTMGDRMVFVFMACIILLFTVVFSLSARVAGISRRLTTVTQQLAILSYRLGLESSDDRSADGPESE